LDIAVASRKTPDSKPEPNVETPSLATAAEKASLVIRGLQARLQQPPLEPSPHPENVPAETSEDLERQLAEYFSKSVQVPRSAILTDIRSRVVDGVAERILRQWERNASIEGAIVERLIERLVDRFVDPFR
jgi:hypothetical protein